MIIMKKKMIILLTLSLIAALWMSGVQTFAVTRYSDGTYTFEKTENNTAIIVECNLTESEIDVPEFVIGYPVVGIGDYSFLNNSFLRSVTLPSSVYSIGEYAFAENDGLERITIPRWCENIAGNAFFNSPNVTFNCYYGSAAHIYAKTNAIDCVFSDKVVLGDVNKDGKVSIRDVTAIQRHLVKMDELQDICLLAADINQDTNLDIKDATALQMYIAEYELSYPINKSIKVNYSQSEKNSY